MLVKPTGAKISNTPGVATGASCEAGSQRGKGISATGETRRRCRRLVVTAEARMADGASSEVEPQQGWPLVLSAVAC
jgi:hypothetical protein